MSVRPQRMPQSAPIPITAQKPGFTFSLAAATGSRPLIAPLEASKAVLGVAIGNQGFLYGEASKRDEVEGTVLYAVKAVLERAKAQAALPSVAEIKESETTDQGTEISLVATRSAGKWTTMITATSGEYVAAVTPIVAGVWDLE